MIHEMLKNTLKNKRVIHISGFHVVTDRVEYDKPDQVFPLHPENQFFLDEIDAEKIQGAHVLEIGLGSAVLSIGAIRAGAQKVTALEINPRAKNFAGFNIVLSRLEDRIELKGGDAHDIYKPVEGQKFDYIISNPPFEPTPPGIEGYTHSNGGIYGLDFTEKELRDLDRYITESGHAQIVSFAPGDEQGPFMLADLVTRYLSGRTTIKVNPTSIRFDDFVDRFVDIGQASREQVDAIKIEAMQDRVTHLYMCMIHYEKGEKSLIVQPSNKTYDNWDLPLDSSVPMGSSA